MENNYQLTRIHNYVTGLMSQQEMYELEREALEDPFLQDAIEGYKLQNGVNKGALSLLQQRLARRIEENSQNRSRQFYSWQRLAIGSTAAVLFLAVCALVFFGHFWPEKKAASQQVLLMEDVLRVKTLPQEGGDVQGMPEKGWTQFNELLNSELKHYKGAGAYAVEFDVQDQGKVEHLTVLQSSSEELERIMEKFIVEKVTWRGKHVRFSMQLEP